MLDIKQLLVRTRGVRVLNIKQLLVRTRGSQGVRYQQLLVRTRERQDIRYQQYRLRRQRSGKGAKKTNASFSLEHVKLSLDLDRYM